VSETTWLRRRLGTYGMYLGCLAYGVVRAVTAPDGARIAWWDVPVVAGAASAGLLVGYLAAYALVLGRA
jgi:hypothetical protein